MGSRKNVLRGVVLVLSDFDIQTAAFAFASGAVALRPPKLYICFCLYMLDTL